MMHHQFSTVFRCLAAGLTLALAGAAPAQVADPTSGGHEAAPIFLPGQDLPAPRPNHPPFSEIPPIPMPMTPPGPAGPVPLDTTSSVHNALTGETWGLPAAPPSELAGGSGPGSLPWGVAASDVEGEVQNAFGNMVVAGSLDSWPRSGNCKLIMRFVDTGGNAWFFSGSGSMQDPGVVLTASHCVYTRTFVSGGITRVVNNWATDIWVYPAWNGASINGPFGQPNGDEVIQNFGWMHGTYFLASNDWINTGGFDYDCGLIACYDRSAGSLTGWFGWQWGGDCAFAQSHAYSNFSYPAEGCGGGLHTGTTMYFLSGFFDSCPGNQLQFNTTAGCTTAVWGGMSGSGAYWTDASSNRYVHAVCSNSNRSTSGRYAKLWEQFSIDMGNFKTGVRGAGFDPETLRFRTTGTTAQAGTSFAGSQVFVANNSYGDPASQTYTLRVYLSSNNNISATDTLLGTWNYTLDFAANSGITFNIPGPFIPASVAPGNYWLGVELTAPGDVDINNNDTDTWDAQLVTITPPAPSNDTCASPIALSVNAPFFGSNALANTEGSTNCGFNAINDVWFSFTPSCAGDYEFTTCGSAFDSVISIHSGCPGTTANQLNCNDDDYNAHCASGFIRDSWLTHSLAAFTTYYVRVSGYNGQSGNYAVAVNQAGIANDDCAFPTPVGDGSYAFNNCGATTDGPAEASPCPNFGADLWYLCLLYTSDAADE